MPRMMPGTTTRSIRASGDRWLFGYADVVTLLFACFAAMYAHSATAAAPVTESATAPASAPARPDRSTLVRAIEQVASAEPQVQMELTTSETGTVISLAETGSFPIGTADLTPAAARALKGLAEILRAEATGIRIEGHTDDRPIRTARYASNWELSTARATRVVQFLVEEGGVPPARLSAAGYGEYRPRLPNDTADARARNRRVDIVLLDATRSR